MFSDAEVPSSPEKKIILEIKIRQIEEKICQVLGKNFVKF